MCSRQPFQIHLNFIQLWDVYHDAFPSYAAINNSQVPSVSLKWHFKKLIYLWVFVTHTLSEKTGSSAPFHQRFEEKRLCYGDQKKKNLLKCNSLMKMHVTTYPYFYEMYCPLDTCAGKCCFALKQLLEISWQIYLNAKCYPEFCVDKRDLD